MCYTFPTSHPLDWLVVHGTVWRHVLHAYDIPPVDKIVGRASAHSPRPAGELVLVSPVVGGARVARIRLVFRVPVVRTTGVLRAAAAPRRRVCCLSLFSRVCYRVESGSRTRRGACSLVGEREAGRDAEPLAVPLPPPGKAAKQLAAGLGSLMPHPMPASARFERE